MKLTMRRIAPSGGGQAFFDARPGPPVHVVPQQVVGIFEDEEFHRAAILNSGEPIFVMESVEEVLRLLREAGVTL